MNIYRLELTQDRDRDYDCTWGVVVLARMAREARRYASEAHGDEGAEAWLDPERSSCKILKLNGTPGVILRDFHAG